MKPVCFCCSNFSALLRLHVAARRIPPHPPPQAGYGTAGGSHRALSGPAVGEHPGGRPPFPIRSSTPRPGRTGMPICTAPNLARAISDDQLWFDPSVQSLLPFPEVLDMMARDIDWTRALGDAFLANRAGVMDAVQRLRHRAWDYGYLRSTPQIMVHNGPYIDIVPVDPGFYYVPYYDPGGRILPAAAGIPGRAGDSLRSRNYPGRRLCTLGMVWRRHTLRLGRHMPSILNDRPWEGVRRGYVHPYELAALRPGRRRAPRNA